MFKNKRFEKSSAHRRMIGHHDYRQSKTRKFFRGLANAWHKDEGLEARDTEFLRPSGSGAALRESDIGWGDACRKRR
jgi:hypothetical protein